MARKPHQPTQQTRGQVEMLAGLGIKHDDISRVIGVSDETLRKYYREQLDVGKPKMVAKVAANLFKHACGEGKHAVNAAKFFLERQGGWIQKTETETTVTIQHEDRVRARREAAIARRKRELSNGDAPVH